MVKAQENKHTRGVKDDDEYGNEMACNSIQINENVYENRDALLVYESLQSVRFFFFVDILDLFLFMRERPETRDTKRAERTEGWAGRLDERKLEETGDCQGYLASKSRAYSS